MKIGISSEGGDGWMDRIEAARTSPLAGTQTGTTLVTTGLNENAEACRSPMNSVWFRSAASCVLQQFVVITMPPVGEAAPWCWAQHGGTVASLPIIGQAAMTNGNPALKTQKTTARTNAETRYVEIGITLF